MYFTLKYWVMDKKTVSEQVLNDLANFFTNRYAAKYALKVAYQSPQVTHFCVESDAVDEAVMGWLAIARDEFGEKLRGHQVILEHQLGAHKMVFVGYLDYWIAVMLARKFGGRSSNTVYWVLYDEPQTYSHYGYIGDKLPTAQEIIQYIETLTT